MSHSIYNYHRMSNLFKMVLKLGNIFCKMLKLDKNNRNKSAISV